MTYSIRVPFTYSCVRAFAIGSSCSLLRHQVRMVYVGAFLFEVFPSFSSFSIPFSSSKKGNWVMPKSNLFHFQHLRILLLHRLAPQHRPYSKPRVIEIVKKNNNAVLHPCTKRYCGIGEWTYCHLLAGRRSAHLPTTLPRARN